MSHNVGPDLALRPATAYCMGQNEMRGTMTARERKKRKDQSLHLTDKRHPGLAIFATFAGVASVVLFFVLCFISSRSHGQAGLFVGFAGIGCFCLSLLGFLCAWASLHQENIRPLFPTISSVINGVSVVFYLFLYIWGQWLQ